MEKYELHTKKFLPFNMKFDIKIQATSVPIYVIGMWKICLANK